MANPHRGEASVEIGGKLYTLRLDANDLCQAEALLDKGAADIMTQISRLSSIRALFWAATREHHPEVTLKQAGEMLTHYREAISSGVMAAFNAAWQAEEAAETGNPPQQNRQQ